MVTIRLILLALVPVYLADGLSDGSEDSNADYPTDRTLDLVCNSYIDGWYTLPPTRRIHKGINAEPGMFPFMGALGWRYKESTKYAFECAGTLISEKFLLTAAHCTVLKVMLARKFTDPKPEIVVFGIENIAEVNTVTEGRQPKVVNIKNMIKHPKYRSPLMYNDIALIETDVIEFTDFIYPACLWTRDRNPDFENKAVIVGWQFELSDIPIAQTQRLKYGKVNVPDTLECENLTRKFIGRLWNGIIDGQLCAKGDEGIDTCRGDSGGPLLYYGRIGRYFPSVVGITSFGGKCGYNDPGVYTRVSKYVDWIEGVAFDSM